MSEQQLLITGKNALRGNEKEFDEWGICVTCCCKFFIIDSNNVENAMYKKYQRLHFSSLISFYIKNMRKKLEPTFASHKTVTVRVLPTYTRTQSICFVVDVDVVYCFFLSWYTICPFVSVLCVMLIRPNQKLHTQIVVFSRHLNKNR